MLDSDLAALYGMTTKRLNQQVHRNNDRFPGDFMFQLTAQEAENSKLQITASRLGCGGRRKPHNVFTEHGAVMLASGFVTSSSRRLARAICPVGRLPDPPDVQHAAGAVPVRVPLRQRDHSVHHDRAVPVAAAAREGGEDAT